MAIAEYPGLVRPTLRFTLAAAVVIAAFLVHQILVHEFGMTLSPFIFVSPAVMAGAFLFGLWPGLMATALAAALVDYWFLEPTGQFGIARASDVLALALFSGMCVFVTLVAERYRRSQRRIAVLERERALLETREQLQQVSESRRLALEAAGLGAWEYHLDTGQVTWDERCRNEFGFATGDGVGYSEVIANIYPDDRKATDQAVKAAIAGANGGGYHREFRVVWPDGSVHWLSSHGRVYFDGENGSRRATRFIGINTDITERRQGESAFEAILQRFYVILSNLNAAVLLVTDDGKVELANKAFCDRFGLEDSAVSLAGLGSEEMIGKIRRAYRYPDEAVLRIGEIVRQGSAVTGEEIPMRDGGACLRDFVPLRVEGKSYGRLWVHTDITERKRMETRLRRFYETDLFAILYWKIDGGVVDVNDRFLKMTGYTREDVRAGRVNWAKMTPPEYLAADEEARRQIRETGVHQPYEKEFIRKDGTRVWGQFWAAAYEDDRSEGVSFILDISERKRTEEDLRRAKREWERTFDSVPDLIAVLDNQHRIMRMNQAMAQRLGATPDGCAGMPCYSCVHGTTAPIGVCPHTLTLRDHREHAAELHEDRLGGDFLVTTTPLFDENGEMDCTVHVARDITESKRAENALKEGEKRYRNLFNAMNEGFCVIEMLFDSEGRPEDYRFLEVNDAFELQTGLHNAVGKRMKELAPAHEKHWFEIYGRIALAGEPAHFMDEAKALGRYYDVHAYRVDEPEMRRVAIVFNDISEYKRAEEALRASEERLRLALDAGRMGTWDMNLLNRGLIWNDEMFLMMGYQPGSVTPNYEGWTRRVHPEDWAGADERFRQSLESGIDLQSEYRVLGQNDEVRWVEARGRSERNANGKAVRSFGVVMDITERRRAEEALQKSEEQFRTLANAIPQLSWMADADGAITWYNDRWYAYTGTTAKEMEGWGWQSVNDPEILPQVLEGWRTSIATGSRFEMVFPLRGADGVFRPFLTRVMPVKDAEGKVMRWFGTNTDISGQKQIEGELRRNEERLNLALEVAQLGEWERDLKGGTTSRSLRHAQIFGYSTVDSEWNFEAFLGHILPEYRAQAAEKLKSQQSDEVVDFETKIRRTDGETRWIWVRSYTRQGENGEPERTYGIVQDITARKQVEEQLQKLNRTLKALSNCNQALLHSDDEVAFLHSVCRIVTEDCGYRMVWIGIAENDEYKSVRPVAWSGFEDGYLQNFKLSWDESASGSGPTGTAIRTGQPSMCRNMQTDPTFAPWRAEATRRGYASSLVIPIKEDERALGAITIYSAAPDAFSEGEVALLTELAGDLTFGIRTLRTRAAHAEAEAALRESEEQLGLFVEHAPVALAMFDNQMRYLRVSRRWKTDYRLEDRDLCGLSHYDVFPEISEQWRESHRRGLAGEVLHKDADRFERADGSAQWVRWEIRPWREHKGEIGGILIFSEEITDRKLADDALREQAELLDLAHDTIMVFDLDGTIRFWNHGAEEMYGYTKEEATGRKSHQLLSTVFPQPMSEIKAQVVRDERWEGELAQVAKNGMGMIVDSRWVVQRDKDGQVRGVMEINSDITTRVKAEDAQREAHLKLQSVLDSITDGLLVLDNDWRFTYCSEHGARILGRRPEDLLGGRFWELFPQAEDGTFGKAFRSAMESRQPVHCEGFYPEPLTMWLECHCYPTPEGLSVYFRDISERKRTEEALLRSEKLASVGRMAATIAHEINNPLAAITNTLFIARMKADDPESVREYLDVAEDELKRITHITRQTLGFYRESSGPVVMSVNAVMDSAVDLMKSKISAKHAVIEKDWEGETMVSAIAGELRQVFANLLGNSLDAIDEGGTIRLRVTLGSDFKGGHAARVTVADNGKGIAAKSKLHIFEPFYTTKGTVGTGLGLWVTKQIIDKHHGKIRLRSSTNGACRGTVFMVILPVERPGITPAEK
jgi:PAS domain S-box-containing protein